MKTALIYSDAFLKYDYGENHPFKMIRLKLTRELIKSCKLFNNDSIEIEPALADKKDVLRFHTQEYLDMLKSIDEGAQLIGMFDYGLGFTDNPPFKGVYEESMLACGGSMLAAKLVLSGERHIAFNIAGGLHHAMRSKASGFCYLNDAAVIIYHLLDKGKRVAYIDIDAHHGDGVQSAFYDTDKVLTISFHENGRFLFPGTGYVEEIGTGAGRGYAVNVSFLPNTTDDVYEEAFNEIVPKLIERFKPDIIVAQLGADCLKHDPITHFSLSNLCLSDIVIKIKGFNIPLIALGGGGYNIQNVYRGWTLAYSIFSEIEAPDEIPQEFRMYAKSVGYDASVLRDSAKTTISSNQSSNLTFVREEIKYLKENLFPIHGIK